MLNPTLTKVKETLTCHSNKDLIIGRNRNNLDICKCQGRFKLFLTLAQMTYINSNIP